MMSRMATGSRRRSTLPLLAGLLMLTACNEEKKGTTVSFQAIHHASPDGLGNIPDHVDPVSRVFVTDQGYQVTLTQGYFVISAVEIRPISATAGLAPWLGLVDMLLPAANAHSDESPTRLGSPNVIDLIAPDSTPQELGHIEPPPTTYSRLRITWGPADDDAGFLPDDFDMVGQTLRLAGRAIKGADTLAFIVADAGTDSVTVQFSPSSAHEAPGFLGVSDGQLTLAVGEEASVGVGMIYDTWFNGVNFQGMSVAAVHDKVLANVKASIGYHSAAGHNHAPARWPTGG